MAAASRASSAAADRVDDELDEAVVVGGRGGHYVRVSGRRRRPRVRAGQWPCSPGGDRSAESAGGAGRGQSVALRHRHKPSR